MALQSVNAQSLIPNPGALLSLFELDSRFVSVNGALYSFHPGVNGLYQPLVFNGTTYTAFPIDISDYGTDGKGNPVRPKLKVSNIRGFISAFLLTQGDLCGAKITRTRVYARFIDGSNFPNGVNPYGTPDPTAAYEPDIFYINRKTLETPEMVEFELTTPFELDNVQLPYRKMLATVCSFKYRDPETCGYSGGPVSDRFGISFTAAAPDGYGFTLNPKGVWSAAVTYQVGDWVTITSQNDFTYGDTLVYVCSVANTVGSFNNPQFNPTNWVADACPHNLLGCKAHFASGPLPFGGYPGLARYSFN